MECAAALIKHYGSSSASEVGLNFPPHRSVVEHGSFRFVEQTGTNGIGTGSFNKPVLRVFVSLSNFKVI